MTMIIVANVWMLEIQKKVSNIDGHLSELLLGAFELFSQPLTPRTFLNIAMIKRQMRKRTLDWFKGNVTGNHGFYK